MKFGVIAQNDELHNILDYFLSAVIPFKQARKITTLLTESSVNEPTHGDTTCSESMAQFKKPWKDRKIRSSISMEDS